MINHLQVVIGYDPKESLTAYVLAHSISRRATCPVSIVFLRRHVLESAGYYSRAPDEKASTDFSLTRFLTPFLNGYTNPILFLDCDMLMMVDVNELFKQTVMTDPTKAVWVVKHDYTPGKGIKMLGQEQHVYPRKNWSSFMLFNPMVRHSVPSFYAANHETPAYLHRMEWCKKGYIGNLDPRWNWLVGEYHSELPDEEVLCLHWTCGGPWWTQYKDAPYAHLWHAELRSMMNEGGGEYSIARDFERAQNEVTADAS